MKNTFRYQGYKIPMVLVDLTGGGADTWDAISKGHMHAYSQYAPIYPNHFVVEIGCGVGRDAIQLTNHLSEHGKYFGVDIIKPSIEWCQQNITPKFPNFNFYFYNVKSQIHNPQGNIKTTQIKLPIKAGTVDRIILQSVFTHMFEDDIIHYLKEFRRILKPTGLIFASFFIIDRESLALAKKNKSNPLLGQAALKFLSKLNGHCYINDEQYPEGAVGYTKTGLNLMLKKAGMLLDQPIHRGFWSGWKNVTDGQDIVIIKPTNKKPLERLVNFLNLK